MNIVQCLILAFIHSVIATKEYVSLLFVGDISFSGLVRFYVEHHHHTYNDSLKDVASYTRAADIAVGNMESPFVSKDVSPHKSPYKPYRAVFLDSSPDSVSALRFAGFDVVSLANNNINDFGEEGVHFTTKVLKDAGIQYFGVSYGKYDSPQTPLIIEKKGIQIGFLGYWDMVTPLKDCSQVRVHFKAGSAIYDDDIAARDINKLKKKVDIIVVFMHWGNEFMVKPFKYQQQITKHLMSLGVHVIMGSHPHVIQPHCLHGNKIVTYSLGNFLFPFARLQGGNAPPVYGGLGIKPDTRLISSYEKYILEGEENLRSSLLFRVNITKHGVLNADYLPLTIKFDTTDKRYHPEPKENAKWVRVCGSADKECQKCF